MNDSEKGEGKKSAMNKWEFAPFLSLCFANRSRNCSESGMLSLLRPLGACGGCGLPERAEGQNVLAAINN